MKTAKYFIATILFVILASCNRTTMMEIRDFDNIIEIHKSAVPGYKFWVVTNTYNFHTDKLYYVGDTIELTK